MNARKRNAGITLIELVVSVGIAALLLAGLQKIVSTGTLASGVVSNRLDLARQARFAMGRMADAVRDGRYLMIPHADDPATNFDENIRVQTFPPSPPQGTSILATAVLALAISAAQDLDANGVPDADNDGDGRIDEDLPADIGNDGNPGVRDFDDDGNGIKDDFLSPAGDDDESNNQAQSEDPFNGLDDDGDGRVDEDPAADNNGDGCAGVCGVDDDGDGSIDEGVAADDDEDGLSDEDWLDTVVFYLQGSSLVERRAVPWDTSGDSIVTGRDFVESTIATNITLLRFERVAASGAQQQLVDITLQLTSAAGENFSVQTRVRLGAPQ